MSQSTVLCGKTLLKELRQAAKALKGCPPLWENRLFERELTELIKTAKEQYITVSENKIILGEKMLSLSDINDSTVSQLIEELSQSSYIGEGDINSLLWQSKLCLIREALKVWQESCKNQTREKYNPGKYYEKMYALRDLDMERLAELSPVHTAFCSDRVYQSSSKETKAAFRTKAALIAREIGIGEERYTPEVTKRAQTEGVSVTEVLETDYRNIFPYRKVGLYLMSVFLIAALLSTGIGLLWNPLLIPLLFFPVFAIVKPFADLLTARRVKSSPLPRMDIGGDLGEGGKTLCVISALVNDGRALEEALEKLKNAKLKNTQKGIYFALLLDLPPKDKEKDSSDKPLFAASEKLRQRIFPESIIFFRKRGFCKTMNKWQGYERKRGAIEQLAEYMCGTWSDFAYVSGNAANARQCEFIAALDLDTVPLMDSIKDLAAAALHPLNQKYGIIAPRCTSTLDSTLKTPFAGGMAGNGGVSGISSYDSFGGEFYFDCFGEGIFCGKGLIKKREFLKSCKDKLPAERVLSHDILEGGFTGVAYSGSTEFSDGFPATSKAYFKRAHRWIRGDFQNIRFIFKKEFSPLTKFKLFDNFRRGINPVLILALLFISCFTAKGYIGAVTAYCSLLLPFLPPFIGSVKRGFGFGITRQFYSPIVSETKQLALRAAMELMTLPKAALVSLDAGIKALWRGVFSKKKLLEWTTSGILEKTAFKGSVFSLLPAFAASLILLVCGVSGCGLSAIGFSGGDLAEYGAGSFGGFNAGAFLVLLGAVIMCAAFPYFLYADKPSKTHKPALPKSAGEELFAQIKKMWRFFEDYTNESTHFLPPDNVQLYPIYRVAMRTSPTNIGMYLLAAAAVFNLGIINKKRFEEIVENSVETVENLEKWKGNLYNWYDLNSLTVISSFVSSVDSGNFLACLIAVKECLIQNKISLRLAERCEKIINETRLDEFYCKKKQLFSIGYDCKTGKLSHHRYDMLMSEARLLSYTAIALGQAPKKHWRALSRAMSRNGRYAGAIAWTGTMFEFYMPELLLTSKEGSMSYEALRYAFYCQKHSHRPAGNRGAGTRRIPFGISESGYYAFDKDLNYQYKAHGVQKTALKGGMDKEYVVSPYSSYLTLSSHPLESWNNLALLEKEGAFNNDYGFYEAVDYTKGRVGDKAVIKSFMAHHTGMAICGAANALKSNICSELFLSDQRMKRAEELLEEKVMAGEKVLKITERHYDSGVTSCEREEITVQKAQGSPVNVLWSGQLALFTSANGCFYSSYKGLSALNKTSDYLNRPQGAFYGFCDEKNVYPFFAHPMLKDNLTTVFSTKETEYTIKEKEFDFSMTVKAEGGHNAEIRKFSVKNKTKSKKQLVLCCYSEPVLAASRDYTAHPMFMDLFLKISYDRDNRLFEYSRKDRHSDNVTACAAGFLEDEDFTYCLSRESCTDYRPFSFFKNAFIRENIENSIPAPCLFIKNSIELDAGEEKQCTLFYCYGDSREEAKKAALDLRKGCTVLLRGNGGVCGKKTLFKNKTQKQQAANALNQKNLPAAAEQTNGSNQNSAFEEDFLSPLSINTLQGRMAERVLAAVLYGEIFQKEILQAQKSNTLNKKELWRFGISGDFPLLVTKGTEGLEYITLLKSGLNGCGINCDLVVICGNALEQSEAAGILAGNGFPLLFAEKEEKSSKELITLIYSLAAFVNLQDLFSDNSIADIKIKKMPKALPVLPCSHSDKENGFKEDGFVIGNERNTWCNILANSEFGTLLSQNSLGFTYALNSRENKLTPWSNDIIKDNYGEMLLIKLSNAYYDLIRGSRAEFSPYSCVYEGTVLSVKATTEVKVYTSGLGKEISLTLANNADTEQSFDLVYKLTPLMASDKESSMPAAYTLKDGAVFFNSRNQSFSGLTALYCPQKPKFCFSALDFASGNFGNAVSGEGVYNSPVAAVIVPIKLPPKENLRIRFILGYYNEEFALQNALNNENIQRAQGDGKNRLNAEMPKTGINLLNAETPKNGTDRLNAAMERAANSALDYLKKSEGSPCGNEFENSIALRTSNKALNHLFNTWLPHQIIACRIWARTGFFQNGGAFGFRDQLQDCLSAMYISPKLAKEHILLCCQSQFEEGDVLHWWHDLEGKKTGVRTRYSDDLLWLPYTACCYDEAYGEEGFWDLKIPFCKGEPLPPDKQELFMAAEVTQLAETVYEHCKRAMEKGFNKGKNGLIKIGCGDWNDGYNNVGVKGLGESVWLAMFYIICGRKFAAAARSNNDGGYAEKLEKRIAELCVSLEENAWDGDWYLRAFYDSGDKMGGKSSAACQIDILPQAFAVLAELPDGDRNITALNSAWDRLVDKKAGIIKLFTPPFTEENTMSRAEAEKEKGKIGEKGEKDGKKSEAAKQNGERILSQRPGYVMSYPEGVRENGGQYTHGAVWYCLACFKAGQKERAYELLNMLNPALKGEREWDYKESYKREKERELDSILSAMPGREGAEISEAAGFTDNAGEGGEETADQKEENRVILYPDKNFGREPYFMTADIYTNPQCYGRGGWSMYTGAAGWYWKCIFEGLLGAVMKKGRLSFKPNLPPELDGTVLKMRLNGKNISVRFSYAGGKNKETAIGEEGDFEVKFGD